MSDHIFVWLAGVKKEKTQAAYEFELLVGAARETLVQCDARERRGERRHEQRRIRQIVLLERGPTHVERGHVARGDTRGGLSTRSGRRARVRARVGRCRGRVCCVRGARRRRPRGSSWRREHLVVEARALDAVLLQLVLEIVEEQILCGLHGTSNAIRRGYEAKRREIIDWNST